MNANPNPRTEGQSNARGGWIAFLSVSVLFASIIPSIAANSYFYRDWTAEDGLPENRVIGLAQTADNYLWVLTRGGLARFDGVRFQTFEAAGTAGFTTSTMWAMYLDRENRLWVGKEQGALVCIAETNVIGLTSTNGLPVGEAPRSMAEDNEGGLWISYSRGMVVRLVNFKVQDMTRGSGLPSGGSCLFATDHDGRLWFAKNGQVGVLHGGKFITLMHPGAQNIQMTPARSGGIWICAGQKVFHYNEGAQPVTLTELPKIRATAEPSALLEDSDGTVWVGTPDGLFRCSTNGVESVETSSPIISSLMEDREGGLWVGTQGGGLNRVQYRVVSLIGSDSGLPFAGVRSVCQDLSGAIWTVGENSALARFQDGEWTAIPIDPQLPNSHSTCVTVDTNGSVWVGTDLGMLYEWKNGEFQNYQFSDGVHKETIRSLHVTTSGDLWVATDAYNTPNYLYRIRGGLVQKFELPPGYRIIRAMAEDADGNFWAGASDGLLVCVTGDTLVDKTAKNPRYSIRCLLGTPDGSLWIGYAGFGVGRLHNGKMERFATSQGLPNDYVSQIQSDGKGGMWFAGNRGIFQVPEQNFNEVAAGRAPQLQSVFYGRSQGFPNLQASFDFCPNAMRDGKGRLYFSMLTGLAEVRTGQAGLNQLPPAVIIELITADNRAFAEYQTASSMNETPAPLELDTPGSDKEVNLPPGIQQVQINFTALSFVAPENVRFRYQLEGIDPNWVDAGTHRFVQYTHLPPGNYRFKVIACNNDGIWNNTGAVIGITLEPHIWETLWFKALVVTAIFSALFGSLILVQRRRHLLEIQHLERQQALERERARIARDLHDDLGIGLTEIGLLGDLASGPVAADNGEASRGYLREITERARELVVLLDEIVWAINPANDTSQSLSDYFLKFAQTLLNRASIRCRLEVAETLPDYGLNSEERHQLFLTFKEALNNVIRHSGATEVRIGLGIVERELVIKVEDNGHGINATAGQGSSDGLKGMQQRLHQLGGRCEIAANANGGTSVKLVIPVRLRKEA